MAQGLDCKWGRCERACVCVCVCVCGMMGFGRALRMCVRTEDGNRSDSVWGMGTTGMRNQR